MIFTLMFIPLVLAMILSFTKKISDFRFAFYSGILFYILILVVVYLSSYYYQTELEKFDINNNGIFEKSEINKEQQKAMQKITSDVGRNFAPFIGIIYALIYFIMTYILLKIFRIMRKKVLKTN